MAIALKNLCKTCTHRKACETPCAPVSCLLDAVSSKYLKERPGDKYIKVVNWRETLMHVFESDDFDDGDAEEFEDRQERRLDLFSFEPRTSMSRVFYERFFLGKSVNEISESLGISKNVVSCMFHHAQRRLYKALEMLDGRDRAVRWYKKTHHELTEHQKWYVLHKIFGLTQKEICEEILPDETPTKSNFGQRMIRMHKEYVEEYDKDLAKAVEATA